MRLALAAAALAAALLFASPVPAQNGQSGGSYIVTIHWIDAQGNKVGEASYLIVYNPTKGVWEGAGQVPTPTGPHTVHRVPVPK